MNDLIKRQDAIMALRLEYPMMPMFKELREEWAIKTEGYRIAEEIIMSLPSAEPPNYTKEINIAFLHGLEEGVARTLCADRPQGEWIPATWQDKHCPERLKIHKCSECGQRAKQILVRTELVDNYYCNKAEPITEYTHKEQLSKFCPNCGCQMKGADDE